MHKNFAILKIIKYFGPLIIGCVQLKLNIFAFGHIKKESLAVVINEYLMKIKY